MKQKADIGLIGLAVMGENLVMNMESKGFTVAVFNRTTEKVDKFVSGRAAGKNIIGCHSLEELVDNLEKQRKVFMMVKAGQAVDDMIEQLLPLLDDGDIFDMQNAQHGRFSFRQFLGAGSMGRDLAADLRADTGRRGSVPQNDHARIVAAQRPDHLGKV